MMKQNPYRRSATGGAASNQQHQRDKTPVRGAAVGAAAQGLAAPQQRPQSPPQSTGPKRQLVSPEAEERPVENKRQRPDEATAATVAAAAAVAAASSTASKSTAATNLKNSRVSFSQEVTVNRQLSFDTSHDNTVALKERIDQPKTSPYVAQKDDNDKLDDPAATQFFAFSHHSQFEEPDVEEVPSISSGSLVAFVRDNADGYPTAMYPTSSDDNCRIYTIGRSDAIAGDRLGGQSGSDDEIGENESERDDLVSLSCMNPAVSRQHAELCYYARDESLRLHAVKKECFVLNDATQKWITVPPNSWHPLKKGQTFRLLPYNAEFEKQKTNGVQFTLEAIVHGSEGSTTDGRLAGSAAMDVHYLHLLKTLKREGQHQTNRKGNNTTLREPFLMSINLQPPPLPLKNKVPSQNGEFDVGERSERDDATAMPLFDNLLPVTTLRKMFPVSAILEAVWYLRGEPDVKFLQRHKQKFWDLQAHDDTGWVGYNYGLLTAYPTDNAPPSINQLEEKVIKPLVAGKTSRNMVCTLCKPGEETVQQACTSSIQFAVSQAGELDLTVTQRSSDVLLGLPHDVIVWATIMHLVRREVSLRTNGKRLLRAGTLNFCISAGGAHYYDINAANLEALLDRVHCVNNVPPHLVVDDWCADMGLMELAHRYEERKDVAKLRVSGYTSYNAHVKIQQAIDA